MKEIYGNAWDLFDSGDFSVLFITTNGFVKKNGAAVMGRGIAAEMKRRYPGIEYKLGNLLQYGNKVHTLNYSSEPQERFIMSFPVKHNWFENADIELIKQSCQEVMNLLDGHAFKNDKFLLPRPGCGNGHLNWEDVKPIIEPLLDDRFYIVDFGKE